MEFFASILVPLKKALGIHFDRNAGPPAPRVKPKKPAPAPIPTEEEDVKLHHVAGISFQTYYDREADSEWELATQATIQGKAPHLVNADYHQLALANPPLDRSKAALIKPLWAMGKSASDISRSLTNQHGRGYSQRTVESYAAAFSKALETPHPEVVATA